MASLPTTWNGTRVTIMGLGSFGGGVGLARYLAQQGACVTVTDLQNATALRVSLDALHDLPLRYVLGEHCAQDFIDTDVVFVNPAVPLTSPYLELARTHDVPLDSEINLFVRQCPGQIIGITGSVGKSTTTALLGCMLQAHDARTLVGGNIGRSLLQYLPDITSDTPVVVELSSFQLEHLAWQQYSPPVAIVLNLVPNHLDRHGTMDAYRQAKEQILAHQTPHNTAILNWDDPVVRSMAARSRGQRLFYSVAETLTEGVYRQGTTMIRAATGQLTILCQQSDLPLHGLHNFGNAAAAAAAAVVLGVPPQTIVRGMQHFRGLPHRLELVTTKGGIDYYNDSKATTPVSTIRAIQAFERPVILLAGGYDKGTPFAELGQVIQTQAKAALLYGKTAPQIAQAIAQAAQTTPTVSAPYVAQLPNLEVALQQAVALAESGDVILLSPACASYDQFAHYEARGERFRTLVQALP